MGYKNTGKQISELGKKQQCRKIIELKANVKESLWFANTFWPTLESAVFSDENGSNIPLNFHATPGKKCYNDLPELEKTRIKEILSIMDRFCIGEAAYHEVTMTQAGENLPRSYLIKQCKESINSLVHIERTPGVCEGAQLNF